MVDELEDALPRCPRCLVSMDVEDEGGFVYIECPSCGDVFL